MSRTGPAKYSAASSLQGYLYQCRYALLLMLRRIRTTPNARLAVEKFDDVSFEKGGAPADVVQTKFHATAGHLTDGSEDWWKTLRIWCEGVRDKHFLLPGVTFSLVTTQTAPPGSAAAALRAVQSGRDPAAAEKLLLAAARASTSQLLAPCFDAFRALQPTKRTALLTEVFVFDAACGVGDLDRPLLEELRLVAPREHERPFLAQIEGWWLRRLIRHLETPLQPPIRGAEVQGEIERVRDGYTHDSLPVEHPLPDPPQSPDPAADPRVFVRRLRRLGLPDRRVRQAILDFYRATVHRDRWVTDTLLNFEEVDEYDDRLLGEWERLCDSVLELLAQPGADPAAVGRQLFFRADEDAANHPAFFIRPRCTEPAISRGSLHKLAEAGKVGWHPDDVTAARGADGGVP